MLAWRDRLWVGPLSALFAIFFVLFGVAFIGSSFDDVGSPFGPRALVLLVAAAAMALVLTRGYRKTRQRERQAAGADWRAARMELDRVMRTGEIGTDTSLDEPLLALIELDRPMIRWTRYFAPLFGLGSLVFVVLALVVHSPYTISQAVLGVGCTFLYWRNPVQGPARLVRLEEALRVRVTPST